jgi:hypothetical protein
VRQSPTEQGIGHDPTDVLTLIVLDGSEERAALFAWGRASRNDAPLEPVVGDRKTFDAFLRVFLELMDELAGGTPVQPAAKQFGFVAQNVVARAASVVARLTNTWLSRPGPFASTRSVNAPARVQMPAPSLQTSVPVVPPTVQAAPAPPISGADSLPIYCHQCNPAYSKEGEANGERPHQVHCPKCGNYAHDYYAKLRDIVGVGCSMRRCEGDGYCTGRARWKDGSYALETRCCDSSGYIWTPVTQRLGEVLRYATAEEALQIVDEFVRSRKGPRPLRE